MIFALSKNWLPLDVQHIIWIWAHDTPHARIMRNVSIIPWQAPEHWALGRGLPIQQLIMKSGVRMAAPLGYLCVNPCDQCKFHENTGIGDICGECRRRPMVYTTNVTNPFPGGRTRTCGFQNPRAAYLRRRLIWECVDGMIM